MNIRILTILFFLSSILLNLASASDSENKINYGGIKRSSTTAFDNDKPTTSLDKKARPQATIKDFLLKETVQPTTINSIDHLVTDEQKKLNRYSAAYIGSFSILNPDILLRILYLVSPKKSYGGQPHIMDPIVRIPRRGHIVKRMWCGQTAKICRIFL